MIRLSTVLVSTFILCFASTASAQRGGRVGKKTSKPLLAIGSPIPDVTLFDELGNEFSTRSLRGHHCVIVFGCLT